MRRTFIAASAAALILWGTSAEAQPVTAFADVAGKWKGTTSTGTLVSLEIEPSGKFNAETPRGKDFGTARIEGGQAILTMTKNPIRLKLSKKGDVLEGGVVSGVSESNITLTRTGL